MILPPSLSERHPTHQTATETTSNKAKGTKALIMLFNYVIATALAISATAMPIGSVFEDQRSTSEDAIAYPDAYKRTMAEDAIAHPDAYKRTMAEDAIAYPDAYKRGAKEDAIAYPDAYKRGVEDAIAYPDAYKRDTKEKAAA
ncbi:MAG: hypothetical protein LQ345_002827 [Seirophora villosa]|nr:MAG: hypothetical protein LQ345_002827 [Seirophora villosa]